jgi:FkbM family methyltransferase
MFYSQLGEDEFLYKNYLNYNNGFFIELGAMDGITHSNTKFFEDELEWTGILIEPTNQYDNLIINRPNCYNFNYAISESENDVDFLGNGAIGGIMNTMESSYKKMWGLNNKNSYKVKSIPINKITDTININKIDLFSIDVEGGEFEVLKTFNWNIPVYIILIELDGHNLKKDKKCQTFMKDKGFDFAHRLKMSDVWINKKYEI